MLSAGPKVAEALIQLKDRKASVWLRNMEEVAEDFNEQFWWSGEDGGKIGGSKEWMKVNYEKDNRNQAVFSYGSESRNSLDFTFA